MSGSMCSLVILAVVLSSCSASHESIPAAGPSAPETGNTNVTQQAITPTNQELATAADALLDTVGYNAQLSLGYYPPISSVTTLFATLNARHLRISAGDVLSISTTVQNLTYLNNSLHVHFDMLTNLYTSPSNVEKAVALLPPGSVDAIEGPNETDNPGQGVNYDPNFAIDIPPYVKALFHALKSTAATRQILVIGPSFVNSSSYAAVGSLAPYVDTGNMHNYFAGFNPGTTGWGASGFAFAPTLSYGSIAWNKASAGQATGTKPVITTETGYSTAPIHGAVPLDVQEKYIPRLVLEQHRNHVPRTYIYQLLGYDNSTGDGSLSLVNTDGSPKPAYHSLAGMLAIFNESGKVANNAEVQFAVTGNTKNVHHALFTKTNGSLLVALWLEVPSFDVNANGGAGAEIPVSAQAVHLHFGSRTSTKIQVWTADAAGVWSSKPTAMIGSQIDMKVSDSVAIVDLQQ